MEYHTVGSAPVVKGVFGDFDRNPSEQPRQQLDSRANFARRDDTGNLHPDDLFRDLDGRQIARPSGVWLVSSPPSTPSAPAAGSGGALRRDFLQPHLQQRSSRRPPGARGHPAAHEPARTDRIIAIDSASRLSHARRDHAGGGHTPVIVDNNRRPVMPARRPVVIGTH